MRVVMSVTVKQHYGVLRRWGALVIASVVMAVLSGCDWQTTSWQTASTDPPGNGETCTVANGTGTLGSTNVTNVVITCSANTYSVGGTIDGLNASGLILVDNGEDATTISANATQFTMNTGVTYGAMYDVTVQTQPAGLVCTVSDGSGTVGAGNVSSVSISCVPNFTLLYSFQGGTGDAADPYHCLIQASDGNLYGTTLEGGSSNGGAIFEITPSGDESVFYAFATMPWACMTQVSTGDFYGTTASGGANGRGTFFEISPSGTGTVLYSFPAGGSDPYTGLIQANDGNFYGTTGANGRDDDGTVFELTPGGDYSVLHTFPKTTSTDGQIPYAGLIQGSDGNFYGTTYQGGANDDGTVFEVTPSGTETVLYSFAGGSDGEHPYAGVIQGSDGNFYGTTYQGGANDDGTVYEVTPSGTETVLYAFAGGGGDGANPEAGLTQGSDGNFYGATYLGGANDDGTVFEVTPSGTETVLHTFTGGSSDGANPSANLVQGSDGNLYGTTYLGGTNNYGTVFEIIPP